MEDQKENPVGKLVVNARGEEKAVFKHSEHSVIVPEPDEHRVSGKTSEAESFPLVDQMDIFAIDEEINSIKKLRSEEITLEQNERRNFLAQAIGRRLDHALEIGLVEEVREEIEPIVLSVQGYADDVLEKGRQDNAKKAEIFQKILTLRKQANQRLKEERQTFGDLISAGQRVTADEVGMRSYIMIYGWKSQGSSENVSGLIELSEQTRNIVSVISENQTNEKTSIPPERVVTKEFDPEKASWIELYNKAYYEADSQERKRLFNIIEDRVEEAEKNGLINKQQIKARILPTIGESTWQEDHPDFVINRLVGLAQSLENDARGMNKYRDNERFEGMVQSLVLSIAGRVSALGIKNALPDVQKKISKNLSDVNGTVNQARVQEEIRLWLARKLFTEPNKVDKRYTETMLANTEPVAKLMGFADFEEIVGKIPAKKGKATGEELYKQAGGEGENESDPMKRYFESETEYREMMLSRGGYDAFVIGEANRAAIDSRSFHLDPPIWYQRLSREQQQMIVTRTNITNLASHISTHGMTNLKEVMGVVGIKIERRSIDTMIKEMPGFGTAWVSLIKNVFEEHKKDDEGKLLHDENNKPILQDHFVISDQGYRLIENFDAYKQALIIHVAEMLNTEKHEKEITKYYPYKLGTSSEGRALTAAMAAVSAADNLLYAGGAYFSGDERRKVVNTDIWAEQPRAALLPGVKGVAKWIKSEEKKGMEEDWGGELGDFMKKRCLASPNFAQQFTKQEANRFFPRRLFFDMFAHTYFREDYSDKLYEKGLLKRSGNRKMANFAETSLHLPVKVIKEFDIQGEKIELFDYENENNSLFLDPAELLKDDLYGGYSDGRSHAVVLYENLTTSDMRMALDAGSFIHHLNKLRGDPMMASLTLPNGTKALWDEDFFVANLALAIMKEGGARGLEKGIDELLPNIDDNKYDSVVTKVLNEPRLYYGMPRDFHKKLLDKFYAKSVHGVWGALWSVISSDAIFDKRSRLRSTSRTNETKGK